MGFSPSGTRASLLALSFSVLGACGSSDPGGPGGNGGVTQGRGGSDSPQGGRVDSSGGVAGSGGAGVSGAANGGGSGTATGGADAKGSGGAPGAGGASSKGGSISTGGVAGATSSGGQSAGASSGGSMNGGAPASGGSASGAAGKGSGGSVGGAASGDTLVSNVVVAVHDKINTVLVVTWTQVTPVDETWLEFSFENGTVLTSRKRPGVAGAHRDVVLGVPASTAVTVRIASAQGTNRYLTKDYMGTTKALPTGLPVGQVISYDATLASPARWLFGAVEDSEGGGDVDYYRATSWLYIMDRQGRMVWYYADPATNATSSFPRLARDGEYIWVEKRPFGGAGTRGVLRMSLDRQFFEEIPLAGFTDCIDVTPEGGILYDVDGELRERSKDGAIRNIWSCKTHFGNSYNCYTNTVNLNPKTNTIFMSFPEPATIVEIDRASGTLVAQFGKGTGAYTFDPPLKTPPTAWSFGFQHFPNLTAEGTLMVSSHMPGYEVTSKPVANQHAFLEFVIDRTAQKLTEKWRYTEGPEWPHAKGMAVRLPNGNTLANYGTGGTIREITPDKRTAFQVKFDTPTGSDFYNKMVGNNELIDDLYALNGNNVPK
jgi:hypothetical protein